MLVNQRLLGIAGTGELRQELVKTALDSLQRNVSVLEQLSAVNRDKGSEALATRTLAGIHQRPASSPRSSAGWTRPAVTISGWTSSRQADRDRPRALEPLKVLGSSKATLGDFELNKLGDSQAALHHYEENLALRREWLKREPGADEAKRGVANALGALARAELRRGDPAKARTLYAEEASLRDLLSQALASQVEVRRERRARGKARRPEHGARRHGRRKGAVPNGRSRCARNWPRPTPTPRSSATCSCRTSGSATST